MLSHRNHSWEMIWSDQLPDSKNFSAGKKKSFEMVEMTHVTFLEKTEKLCFGGWNNCLVWNLSWFKLKRLKRCQRLEPEQNVLKWWNHKALLDPILFSFFSWSLCEIVQILTLSRFSSGNIFDIAKILVGWETCFCPALLDKHLSILLTPCEVDKCSCLIFTYGQAEEQSGLVTCQRHMAELQVEPRRPDCSNH